MNTPDKFWEKVAKRGPDDCWLWMGSIDPNSGYGQFCAFNRKIQTAHCYSYYLKAGVIGDMQRCVLHRCNVRKCVNPNHLYLGTVAENNKDRYDKERNERIAGMHQPKHVLNDEAIDLIHEISEKYTGFVSTQTMVEKALRVYLEHLKQKELY